MRTARLGVNENHQMLLQLRKPHLVQNGPELIQPPRRHRGLYLHPRHKYHRCRPGTLTCTFVLRVMRRSCPWRNSNIILSPITKRAGSPYNTASNDVVGFSSFFCYFLGLSPPFLSRSPVPGSQASALTAGRSLLGGRFPPDFPSCMTIYLWLSSNLLILEYTIISIPPLCFLTNFKPRSFSQPRPRMLYAHFRLRPHFTPPFLTLSQGTVR